MVPLRYAIGRLEASGRRHQGSRRGRAVAECRRAAHEAHLPRSAAGLGCRALGTSAALRRAPSGDAAGRRSGAVRHPGPVAGRRRSAPPQLPVASPLWPLAFRVLSPLRPLAPAGEAGSGRPAAVGWGAVLPAAGGGGGRPPFLPPFVLPS